MSRAEMEICKLAVPIAANDRRKAEVVTGIARAGVDPKRHEGRSLSQASTVGKESLELRACQTMLLDHAPVRIGHGDLKTLFARSTATVVAFMTGLLLVALTFTPHDASWHDDADRSEGVHPITGSDSQRRSAVVRGTPSAFGEAMSKERHDVLCRTDCRA
jgi:hypothetical protein